LSLCTGMATPFLSMRTTCPCYYATDLDNFSLPHFEKLC
jgi:hypothetical protein